MELLKSQTDGYVVKHIRDFLFHVLGSELYDCTVNRRSNVIFHFVLWISLACTNCLHNY